MKIGNNVNIYSWSTIDAGKPWLITIGNNVFIGTGSIILCNVKIGDNVIVGVGSVVSHN